MRPGIWIPPCTVSPTSALAKNHQDWLLAQSDAGVQWRRRIGILDITNPAAADYVTHVIRTFAGWGFSYYKLDFLYAAAIPGLEAYRQGMLLIRKGVGPDAIILIGGAPLPPSIGLCDAMRIGPQTSYRKPRTRSSTSTAWSGLPDSTPWMNGRLWVNDPDCLVARPEIKVREAWAAHLENYGGVAFSSDRLAALDERGLELTRRFLS